MLDPDYRAEKAQRDYSEYQKNPKEWSAKTDEAIRSRWIAIYVFYFFLLVIAMIYAFPNEQAINAALRSERFKTLFPYACLIFGLLLFLLKYKSPSLFGIVEMAFAFASAFAAIKDLDEKGIAAWAVAVGVVFLFTQGIGNVMHGYVEMMAEHDINQQPATSARQAD